MASYKPFDVQYNDTFITFAIGKKTKNDNVKCGSVTVNNDDDFVTEIHIQLQPKIQDRFPVTLKRDVMINWAQNQGFTVDENTKILVKRKSFNRTTKEKIKFYEPIDEWLEKHNG